MTLRLEQGLHTLRLQATPAYDLVLFDRLSSAEQRAFEALRGDPEAYGVLRPRHDARLSMKSVSRDVALLWYTLQSAGPLPRYLVKSPGEQCEQVIGQLILDGIFAIESEGRMLTGPAACALLSAHRPESGPETTLASLSRRALEYAEALDLSDAVALSARLYSYNHLAASSRWTRLLADQTAVERHLGMSEEATRRVLEKGWTRVTPAGGKPGWTAWQSQWETHGADRGATYKLYVSPACSELRAAFQATAEAVAHSRAFHWKVGPDVHGLLRPDKMVVYFREFAALQETGARIAERLDGCPAQGVPFTSELAGAGLLSWGMDPPAEQHSVAWLRRESWRLRICNRLAAALLLAKVSTHSGISASRFAMERLQLEGVDTETWAPGRTLAWT